MFHVEHLDAAVAAVRRGSDGEYGMTRHPSRTLALFTSWRAMTAAADAFRRFALHRGQ